MKNIAKLLAVLLCVIVAMAATACDLPFDLPFDIPGLNNGIKFQFRIVRCTVKVVFPADKLFIILIFLKTHGNHPFCFLLKS